MLSVNKFHALGPGAFMDAPMTIIHVNPLTDLARSDTDHVKTDHETDLLHDAYKHTQCSEKTCVTRCKLKMEMTGDRPTTWRLQAHAVFREDLRHPLQAKDGYDMDDINIIYSENFIIKCKPMFHETHAASSPKANRDRQAGGQSDPYVALRCRKK